MSIRRLPVEVVNRIAAGEVLVRPSNAIKELIENSIDAGSRNIMIMIGNGGLQTIQVVDDGHGIALKDHSLVCERFATSKLRCADDLVDGKVLSFGFRGEALASMSMVGHVTVCSKCAKDDTEGGNESRYNLGKLLPGYPVRIPFNGESGTRIIVDDLFFDNPVRKRGFKQPSSEYKRILDLVSRFAVAFPDIGFRMKKVENASFDIVEDSALEVSRLMRVENLFGVSDAIHILLEDSENPPEPLKLLEVIISNPLSEYTSRQSTSSGSTAIVVINNRLVECVHLVKLIETELIAQTQTKPRFVFLNLLLDCSQLDVNVCPTKGKVFFANQSVVDRWIVDRLMEKLNERKRSKILKVNKIIFEPVSIKEGNSGSLFQSPARPASSAQPFKIHTCSKQNFLTSTLQNSQDDVFISLTQIDHPPLVNMKPLSPRAEETEMEKYCSSLVSMDLELTLNPRDFVWVGEIGDGFAICQFTSRLCICNVRHTFVALVSRHFLRTQFALHEIEEISWRGGNTELPAPPAWICDMLCSGDLNAIRKLPSIRQNNEKVDASIVRSLFGMIGGKITGPLSQENVRILAEIFAEFILETEFESNYSLVWNDVIRNKTYCDIPRSENSPKLELLSVDQRKNFFFRELISLKDVYKEFERC